MRFLNLAILILAVTLPACASSNSAKKPTITTQTTPSIEGQYEFVSVDLSICGKTGTLPVRGIASFRNGGLKFDFIDPILGEERIQTEGAFLFFNNGMIVLNVFDTVLKGQVDFYSVSGGNYMRITILDADDESKNRVDGDNNLPQWVFRRK